ncbi:hypothetical protein FB446DRAFT_655704, partial [Lentinula raphanica]
CGEKMRQGLKTGDRGSTGNMREHVKKCWDEEALEAVANSTLEEARNGVKELSKGNKQHSPQSSRLSNNGTSCTQHRSNHSVVTVRWVAESARLFRIVQDRCFRWLQKEGRPNQYVPSKATVARDVKTLYEAAKEQLAKELQVSIHIYRTCQDNSP